LKAFPAVMRIDPSSSRLTACSFGLMYVAG